MVDTDAVAGWQYNSPTMFRISYRIQSSLKKPYFQNILLFLLNLLANGTEMLVYIVSIFCNPFQKLTNFCIHMRYIMYVTFQFTLYPIQGTSKPVLIILCALRAITEFIEEPCNLHNSTTESLKQNLKEASHHTTLVVHHLFRRIKKLYKRHEILCSLLTNSILLANLSPFCKLPWSTKKTIYHQNFSLL